MSYGVLNVASSIAELEQKAYRAIPSIDDEKSPSIYFQQARSFQTEAREFRLEGDDEREYMANCKFSRLVRNLDNHLNIGRYQAEYNGLKLDVNMISTRMEELRKRIQKLYNATNDENGADSGDYPYYSAQQSSYNSSSTTTTTATTNTTTTTTNTTPIDLSAFWKSTSLSSTPSIADSSSSRNFDSDFSLTPSSTSTSRDYFSTNATSSSLGWGSKDPWSTSASASSSTSSLAKTTTTATTATTTPAAATLTTGYDAGSGKSIYERARLTKEADSFALPELPQLPTAPPVTDDYDYSYGSRDRRGGADSKHHAGGGGADSSKKAGIFSGWFGGGSSGTASTKKSHPRRARRNDDNDNDDEEEQDDDFLGHAMGNVMATAAQNEQVQEQLGSALGHVAKSKEFRQSMGDAIASTTDNEFVAQVARNDQFQNMIGEAVSRTAGNKEFQRKVGQTLSNAAQNKELRAKAKKGALAMGRGLKTVAAKGWDLGLGIYEATTRDRAAQNADDDEEEYDDED